MNIDDLVKRCSALMLERFVFKSDGTIELNPKFREIQSEVLQALKLFPNNAVLIELDNGLTYALDFFDTLQANPEIARAMNEAMDDPLPSDPEIFDAIDNEDVDAVKTALKSFPVNARYGKFGGTALYRAMSNILGVSLEVMTFLLDAGADPKQGLAQTNVLHGLGFANLDGINPRELSKIVRRCVSLGADIEQRSENLKWTPLITAVSEWNPIATEALLLAGADITACAGDTGKGCFSGAGVFVFAEGHEPTMAVLRKFSKAN